MIIFEQINVIEMENKRRDFLKTACAPVVFSMFGITMLEACSSGEDDGYGTTPNPGSGDNTDGTDPEDSVSIDLTSSNFSNIADVGGWMNYKEEKMLLLRISDNEIRLLVMYVRMQEPMINGVTTIQSLLVEITTGLLMTIVRAQV